MAPRKLRQSSSPRSNAKVDFPSLELSSESSEAPSDEEETDWGPHRNRSSVLIPPPPPKPRYNRIMLHIYDLIASDTLMQLPWGCMCEIGKCFNDVNTALHELGTGAYHVGVDVNGTEYAFGATTVPGKSGVFSCIPKLSPGYQYRTTIDFGKVPLARASYTGSHQHIEYLDGKVVIKEMASEYMGADYNILRRNCCTFAYEACVRLGVRADKIPSWFRNLAETGAYSQDFANKSIVEPLQRVLSQTASPSDVFSFFSEDNSVVDSNNETPEKDGFEMVARRNESNTRDVVVVLRSDRTFRRSSTTVF